MAEPYQGRNFVVLALYQIVVRTGWIFKTESIIMPAVLDTIGGAGWLRGFLPLLNRFGQSVPPLLFASRLKAMRQKKWAVAGCSLGMSAAFLTLAALWLFVGAAPPWWMPGVFLVIYSLFFISTGMNQLSFGTLQGKLIRPTLRGRLLTSATLLGAVTAILAAWFLLGRWLGPAGTNFHLLFTAAGVCFGLAALVVLTAAEPDDNHQSPTAAPTRPLAAAWHTLRRDDSFRRLAPVAMLFGTSMILFPHYQALGREQLGLSLGNLVLWVIVQNAGAAMFSLVAGPLADRRGNRLVLRIVMLGVACVPVVAVALSYAGEGDGAFYTIVFLMLGLTPIGFKTLANYALELGDPSEHPRYLSTLALCMATPILLSPVVGLLIDVAGFRPVFFGISALLVSGWVLTFRLNEPRHRVAGEVDAAIVSGDE